MHHRNSWSYIGQYTKSKMKKDMDLDYGPCKAAEAQRVQV